MVRCRVRLEGPSTYQSKLMHEVQVRSAVQQLSIESALTVIEEESVLS